MATTDYNKKKDLEITSQNDSGATIDKAQPVLLEAGGNYTSNVGQLDDSSSITDTTSPAGIAFNDDGTKLYIVGNSNASIYEYNLSTAYDVSTKSFVQSFDLSGQDSAPFGVDFKPDGTKMYITGETNTNVYEYNLSTAYDVSSASFNQSLDVSGDGDLLPHGFEFNDDGTKFFLSDNTGSTAYHVNEYSLSTAYDISTASFVQNFSVLGEDENPRGLAFKPDGTRMFITGQSNDNIYRYDLSTAYDISTASFVESFDVGAEDGTPRGIVWNSDGSQINLVGGGTNSTYTYNVTDTNTTGTGDIVLDWTNISSESDIAVYDQDGNLLPYEIESFDATAETAVLWCYNSWVRDDTVQAQIVYGDGPSSSEENVTGTWDNTGQNAEMVQHLNEDTIEQGSTVFDSSPNGNDGTVETDSDGQNKATGGQFDGAASFDGTDDYIDIPNDFGLFTGGNDFTIDFMFNPEVADADEYVWSMSGESEVHARWDRNGNNVLQFQTYDGSTEDNIDSTSLSNGTWYVVVFTYDASTDTKKLYVDATSQGTSTHVPASLSGDNWIGNREGDENLDRHFDGSIDEFKVFSEKISAEWVQADYDASPKAGQVFFSQQAAETTVQTQEETFSQDVSIKDEDVTKGFSQTVILENRNIPEQFSQDIAVKDADQTKVFDSDTALQDRNVEKTFTQDITVLDRDAEKTFTQDISLKLEDETATFDQDVFISAGNEAPFTQDVSLKNEDVTKQLSTDLILENANIPEQFSQDVNIADRDVEVTFSQDTLIADLDNEETFSQDVYVSQRMTATFDNTVVIAKQPAPDVENPLTTKVTKPTETHTKVLKPTNTYVEVREVS